MALFTQENLIIPLTDQNGVDAADAVELDSFNMSKYGHATVVIMFAGTVTGDNVLTVERATSDAGDSSDATFHYRLGSAVFGAANSDVLAADATASTLTLTAATYQNKMLVLELDGDETGGYNWITVDFDGAASVGAVTAIAILSKPRYAEAVMDTALA